MYIYGEVNVVVMLLFSRQKNWETCDRKREKKFCNMHKLLGIESGKEERNDRG